jgi:hypothetical protein
MELKRGCGVWIGRCGSRGEGRVLLGEGRLEEVCKSTDGGKRIGICCGYSCFSIFGFWMGRQYKQPYLIHNNPASHEDQEHSYMHA